MSRSFSNDETQRRALRVPPDDLEIAHICFDTTLQGKAFKAQIVAIVLEENVLHGCGVAVRMRDEYKLRQFQIGDRVLLRLGELGPIQAEVRWRRVLDDAVLRLGFAFLE